MLWYLLWRAITKKDTRLTLSFLVVGHTKFAPDWCLGLFKRKYRVTPVSSLNSISEVVKRSPQCNHDKIGSGCQGSHDGSDVRLKDLLGPLVQEAPTREEIPPLYDVVEQSRGSNHQVASRWVRKEHQPFEER